MSAHMDPQTPGSLGGVYRYAQAQGLTQKEALRELQEELAYTLHRPVHLHLHLHLHVLGR